MNILQIAPRVPFPPDDGGAIGVYNITKYLALRGHNIRFLTFSSDVGGLPAQFTRYCSPRVVNVITAHSPLKVGLSLFRQVPYTISKYYSKVFLKALFEEFQLSRFDIVHVDHLAMSPYGVAIKEKYGIPIVLREHNLETVFLERFMKSEPQPFVRWFVRFEAARMRSFEPSICKKFNRCIMITENEQLALRQLDPSIKTAVIPAGVETAMSPRNVIVKDHAILFLASLNWRPNIQGFQWFLDNVLPHVIKNYPSVLVTIVGKGDSGELSSLRHPNIRYVGYVEDVSPYIVESTLAIVPLFAGGGMRIKILELFAHGKPVVSTSVGCEGIQVENGRELFIADSPVEFANSIINILKDNGLQKRLGTNGQELVRKHYSWEAVAEQLEQIYLEETRSNEFLVRKN